MPHLLRNLKVSKGKNLLNRYINSDPIKILCHRANWRNLNNKINTLLLPFLFKNYSFVNFSQFLPVQSNVQNRNNMLSPSICSSQPLNSQDNEFESPFSACWYWFVRQHHPPRHWSTGALEHLRTGNDVLNVPCTKYATATHIATH